MYTRMARTWDGPGGLRTNARRMMQALVHSDGRWHRIRHMNCGLRSFRIESVRVYQLFHQSIVVSLQPFSRNISYLICVQDGFDGGTIDTMYGWLGAASFFYEIGTNFYQPCDTFPPIVNEVFPGLLVRIAHLYSVASYIVNVSS